jgi:hypothetical protein
MQLLAPRRWILGLAVLASTLTATAQDAFASRRSLPRPTLGAPIELPEKPRVTLGAPQPIAWVQNVAEPAATTLTRVSLGDPEPVRRSEVPCVDALKGLDICQLNAIFAEGEVVAPPVGYARGIILVFSDCYYRCPRLSACLSGAVWKGKHFDACGGYVNQFLGVRAISSTVRSGPSWFDGKPCVILDYPDGTPVFGDMRDEVRRVGPDVYLARVYNRCTCEFRGYIVLHPTCRSCCGR